MTASVAPQDPPTARAAHPVTKFVRSPWLLGAALFIFCLSLDTRHNDFPYTYHPDERGKVFQVIRRERNYHHPLLMLSTTDWITRLGFIERTPQKVVQTGRWVTASFAAGSVVALALLAYFSYGVLAAWAAGLVLAFQTDLFKTAHYMKEDPVLMFGLAMSLLGAHLWWRAPGKKTLRFFAIACGLAASGKYLGIVTLIFAIPMILRRNAPDDALTLKVRVKQFALWFGLVFLICNAPIYIRQLTSPVRSIKNEMNGIVGGHRGLTRTIPHGVYLGDLRYNVSRPIYILAGLYALLLIASARHRTPDEWLLLIFPILYFGMLSFSPKIADRYLLPVTVLIAFAAALGAAEIARLLNSRESAARQILSALALVGCAAWLVRAEWPAFRETFDGYRHDDPGELVAWVKANLPLTAVIAEDHRVNLSISKAEGVSKDKRVPHTVLDSDFVADLGTLDELRSKGVTYVAVSKPTYGRFSGKDLTPREAEKTHYDKRKAFYEQLFREGELVRHWPSGKITYLQPGIDLYRIARVAD